MTKKVMIAGVVGLGLVYWVYRQKQKVKPGLGIPAPVNSAGSRPRVDNQSQPWYTQAAKILGINAGSPPQNPTAALKDASSAVHSLSDIWGTVSGIFDDSGTESNVDDVNFVADDLPGSDIDQSNVLGDQIGNTNWGDVAEFDYSFSDDTGTLDDSFADMGSDNYETA